MRVITLSILLFILCFQSFSNDSWERILSSGSGKVTFYWYPNNVYISDSRDIIDGFEKDLAFAFIDYLNKKYGVTIELEWKETNSFDEILSTVKDGTSGMFGASSISITDERAKDYLFTPPYLADIIVLVSGQNVPLANSSSDFAEIFEGKTAISIRNTTLNNSLLKLKNELSIDFEIDYVKNTGEIIEKLEQADSSFAYIDLPNFLIAFKNAAKIRRQLFYPIRLEGIAMIYPQGSDWSLPVQDYFTSGQFREDKRNIILKYFGNEIGDIIDRITVSAEIGPFEEILISNREKELQYQELLETMEREREQHRFNEILTVILILLGAVGAFLLVSNRIKSQVNKVLVEQQSIIEERNEELKQLNEEKNDLIKVLAHDLRSPISNIDGCAMLLKDQEEHLSGDAKKMIGFILESSERIQAMITKILDVEAIDSKEHNMQLEKLCPSDIAEEIIDDYSEKAEKKDIRLSLETEDHLLVKADRFYLAQVIENLLSNAIKYSENGKPVMVSLFRKKDMVRIEVKDFGPGMSKEDKKKVFKKFQKLSSKPTGGEESVGLGLSIVKRYTEMMGGQASFKSKPRKGSEFYIDLKAVG